MEEIAQLIAPSFPESEPKLRRRAVTRYLQQHTWAPDPSLREEGFHDLQDILIGGAYIRQRYPYGEHVNAEFAQAALQSLR